MESAIEILSLRLKFHFVRKHEETREMCVKAGRRSYATTSVIIEFQAI